MPVRRRVLLCAGWQGSLGPKPCTSNPRHLTLNPKTPPHKPQIPYGGFELADPDPGTKPGMGTAQDPTVDNAVGT